MYVLVHSKIYEPRKVKTACILEQMHYSLLIDNSQYRWTWSLGLTIILVFILLCYYTWSMAVQQNRHTQLQSAFWEKGQKYSSEHEAKKDKEFIITLFRFSRIWHLYVQSTVFSPIVNVITDNQIKLKRTKTSIVTWWISYKDLNTERYLYLCPDAVNCELCLFSMLSRLGINHTQLSCVFEDGINHTQLSCMFEDWG